MRNISASFLAESTIFIKWLKTFFYNIFSYFLEKGLYNFRQRSKHSKNAVLIENIFNKQKNSGYGEENRNPRFSTKWLKPLRVEGLKK
jgi:hypothetical protein